MSDRFALPLCAFVLLWVAGCDTSSGGGGDDVDAEMIDASLGMSDVGDGDDAGRLDMGTDDEGIPVLDMEVFTDTGGGQTDGGGDEDMGPAMLPALCLMPPPAPEQPPLMLEAVRDLEVSPIGQAYVVARANFDKLMQRVNEQIGQGIERGAQSGIITLS